MRNFLAVTLLSLGLPMIAMGDEVRRSQAGNNNAYCQDNEISWFDWALVDRHADLRRFVALLNSWRLLRDVEFERQRMTLIQLIEIASKTWHGVKLGQPDWSDHSHSLAFEARGPGGFHIHVILNAYWEPLAFELPPVRADEPWLRWIDTALGPPEDIVPWTLAPAFPGTTYRAEARSVVMLFRETGTEKGGA